MLARMVRGREAARKGREDGLQMIPDAGRCDTPRYLEVLRLLGERETEAIAVRFDEHEDEQLHGAYRQSAARVGQALGDLQRQQAQADQAQEAYKRRPSLRARMEVERQRALLKTAQRRYDGACLELEAAVARREKRFRVYQGRALVALAEIGRLQRVYMDANIAAREDNSPPPAFAEERVPRPQLPEALRELTWDPPLAVARSGRFYGQGESK